jgi:beta-glucosidase
MTMPGDISFFSGTSYFGANLTEFVRSGKIPMSRVDDMATRIVGSWYFVHQDASTYPHVNFDAFRPLNESVNEHVETRYIGGDHGELVRTIGAASTVLLKNVNNTLPLKAGDGKKGMSLVLVGSDAGPARAGPNRFADQGGVDGVVAMGWGSGYVFPSAGDVFFVHRQLQDCQFPISNFCML